MSYPLSPRGWGLGLYVALGLPSVVLNTVFASFTKRHQMPQAV